MKKIVLYFIISGFLLVFASDIYAQTVKISAEVRPRFEYRHGYKTLFPEGDNAASFISQRTRLNGYFSNKTFKAYVSLQNVRVWGDVNQLNKGDVNGVAVHEAWGQVFFGKMLSLKFGRQEIIYDDHRIFGSVGWAQQARSHDAAILGIKVNENHKIDIGIAYNSMMESLYKTIYTNSNYKALQLLHYHGSFGKSGISFLFLNNGMEYGPDTSRKVAYSQTFGPRYTWKGKKIKFNLAAYYQCGKNGANNDLSGLYFGGDVSMDLGKRFNIGLGGEYLSGTATTSTGTDKSFTPFYGTNHKFNGWMDYFYVGNHGGNVGLVDIYLPIKFKKDKISAAVIPHYFMSAATVTDAAGKDYDSGLGTEIDFTIAYAAAKNVVIAAGFSQMIDTDAMKALKYTTNPTGDFESSNWGWVMITFKPTFFSKE